MSGRAVRLELGRVLVGIGTVALGLGLASDALAWGSMAHMDAAIKFRSQGEVRHVMGTVHRDRTITFRPGAEPGQMEVSIVDHAEGDALHKGMASSGGDGAILTDDLKLVNACNILAVTPMVIQRLRKSNAPVVMSGRTEVRGRLVEVQCTHKLVAARPDGAVRVQTQTRSEDGVVDVTTLTQVDADGLPEKALTRGTLKGWPDLHLDLSLQRLDPAVTPPATALAPTPTQPAVEQPVAVPLSRPGAVGQ